MIIKTLIFVFLLSGMIGIGIANGYFNQAFWHSEALWLDEDDFDEDVDRWMRYGNHAYKISIFSFLFAFILAVLYWML